MGGFAAGVAIAVLATSAAFADTLTGALTQAYQNNPQLNSQRAAVRATDETVPQALSGYRPRASLTANVGEQYLDTVTKSTNAAGTTAYSRSTGAVATQSYGGTVTQTLFNGLGTASRTRQAEQLVSAARETLRLTEQTVLLNAATAYMNLIRDAAILQLQRQQRRGAARAVAPDPRPLQRRRSDAHRRGAGGIASCRRAGLDVERGIQLHDVALHLSAGDRRRAGHARAGKPGGSPVAAIAANRDCRGAGAASFRHHRDVQRRRRGVSGQDRGKLALSELNLVGSAQKNYGSNTSLTTLESFAASVAGQLTIPLYQGGTEYATIRQAKETLSQRRTDLDTARDQSQQTLVQSWGQLEAAKAQIQATTTQVNAAEIALNGVREEARVGQRTTLDVLNAQQELVNARVALVTAQRDRVVASYSLLAASGRLSPSVLGLAVTLYDPKVHYHQVRDTWVGVRTPDGK